MSNYSKLYWLTRLDYLQGLFVTIAIVFGVILMIYLIRYLIVRQDDYSQHKSELAKFVKENGWAKRLGIIFLSSGVVLASLTPSTKEAIFIIAGGKTIDFAQHDSSINKIPGQATQVISAELDKKIKEIEEEVKK